MELLKMSAILLMRIQIFNDQNFLQVLCTCRNANWICGARQNHQQLTKFTNRYLGYNRISEILAIAALDSPDYYFDIAQKMKQDRKLYYSRLGQIPGFSVFQSNANFILVEIPHPLKMN